MRIALVTPAPAGSRHGNRTTALRWARILRSLGHHVHISQRWERRPADLLIALHAHKSASSVAAFHRAFPSCPIVVALTGTDIYGKSGCSAAARRTIAAATRLVVLQPLARGQIGHVDRRKARVIVQSVALAGITRQTADANFAVLVLAHLRPVKDPFRVALATRTLPHSSRVCVRHLGAAIGPTAGAAMAARARREERLNPRYHWLGERSRTQALRELARAALLVVPSRSEGGANVVSEAIALGVPVLASRIPGNVGLLGRAYPGYFPAGDTRALRSLLLRSESDRPFYSALVRAVARRQPTVRPEREHAAWSELLRELRWTGLMIV